LEQPSSLLQPFFSSWGQPSSWQLSSWPLYVLRKKGLGASSFSQASKLPLSQRVIPNDKTKTTSNDVCSRAIRWPRKSKTMSGYETHNGSCTEQRNLCNTFLIVFEEFFANHSCLFIVNKPRDTNRLLDVVVPCSSQRCVVVITTNSACD
jgi:hypothetical protein